MAIKIQIPTGQTHAKTSALYQWDYGQVLEIEAAGLPSLIEVHFACNGMNEAVVHTCSCVDNIATVAIPDRCLEQPNEITAWVYEIDGTAGRTIYSIYIPIIARTRPARSESIPQSVQDTYSKSKDGNKKVSTNFKVKEFACQDGSDPIFIDSELVSILQKIRTHFGKAVTITSAYRTPSHNQFVGGATFSQHQYGKAADIQIAGISPKKIAAYAETLLPNKGGIGIYGTFTHIDVRETKSR